VFAELKERVLQRVMSREANSANHKVDVAAQLTFS
jgi:hypothetical protein